MIFNSESISKEHIFSYIHFNVVLFSLARERYSEFIREFRERISSAYRNCLNSLGHVRVCVCTRNTFLTSTMYQALYLAYNPPNQPMK